MKENEDEKGDKMKLQHERMKSYTKQGVKDGLSYPELGQRRRNLESVKEKTRNALQNIDNGNCLDSNNMGNIQTK